MEVGREQTGASQLLDDVVGDGPGEAEAVEGGRAPAQLVDDD